MEWDLGIRGVGVLLAMSLGFAAVTQLVMWKATTHKLWMIIAVSYFLAGIFISEVWFGWATEEDLQPNIDGLSFDEVLLIGFVPIFFVTLAVWAVGHRKGARPTRVA